MKRTLKITALALVLATLAILLVSCGTSFGGIRANFEKHNYELKSSEPGKIEYDGKVLNYTIHTFQLKKNDSGNFFEDIGSIIGSLVSTAVVWEFSSNADLNAALEQNDTLKGLLESAQKTDFVNGNCVLLTVNTDAIKLFKGESLS